MTRPSCIPAGPALVTGATGFIGRRLVRRLRDEGAEVRALVLPTETLPSDWDADVRVLRGDISSQASVAEAVSGCPTIFHLAAVVGDWGPEKLFRRITVDGTRYVLGAAGPAGGRVVLASSIVVYGDRLGRVRCDENTELGRPYGPYSRAKQAQERLAVSSVASGHCDVRIVRPANVYGPGSRPWVDETTRLLKAGRPVLIGGGRQNAGLAYVDNVVDILVRAAGDAAAPGDIFNACDELPVTWARYLGDLASLVKAPAPRSVPGGLAWPLALAMEFAGKALRLGSRPPLTREAVHLVSADHDVPSARARAKLGDRTLVYYEDGLEAVAAYLAARR
jgi:nucleoside-diphosphate-sugar epimerase